MNKFFDNFPNVRQTNGEVGIEIEVEGRNLPHQLRYHWRVEGDGSLRGDESAEYVLKHPVPRDKVDKVLSYWKKVLGEAGSRIDNSERTSVHVHINVQEMTFTQITNFALLYMIMEEALVKFCGPTREGNLFCLRAKDAEYLVNQITNIIRTGNYRYLQSNDLRYASINFVALTKYGSLEFRAMRGTDDIELISNWVSILLKLKDIALKYKRPSDIVSNFSMMGGERWMQETLGDLFPLVKCDDLDIILQDGVRCVQDIAYADTMKKVKQARNKKPIYARPDGEIVVDEGFNMEPIVHGRGFYANNVIARAPHPEPQALQRMEELQHEEINRMLAIARGNE